MLKLSTTLVGLALPAAVLAGCASAPASAKPRAQKDCINTREINAMDPLTDQHVFVRLSASRHVLLTMEDTCQGLELARRLAVWEAGTRLCAGGTSLLAFEHPTVGSMRCRVGRIDSVRDKDSAWDFIRTEVPVKPKDDAQVIVPPE